MSSSVMVVPQGTQDLITFNDEQVALIRSLVTKDSTDSELQLFLYQCKRTGLDPLAKQIYFQMYVSKKNGDRKMTVITSIDGYRLIADRTKCYAGNDEPVYEGRKSFTYTDYGTVKTVNVPVKATVTVWKIVQNLRVAFSSSAYWDEYYPGDTKGAMWCKMPHVMLAKCAEAAALRKAFPNDLSGVYIQEEMEQAQGDIITVVSETKNVKATEPKPENDTIEGESNVIETETALSLLRTIITGNSNKSQATDEQQANMKTALVHVFGKSQKGVTFLSLTTESQKISELNAGEIIALLQWFGATESNGYTPSQDKAELAKQIAG